MVILSPSLETHSHSSLTECANVGASRRCCRTGWPPPVMLVLFGPQPLALAGGAVVIEHVSYRIIYLAAAVVLLGTAIGLWARGDQREDSYR